MTVELKERMMNYEVILEHPLNNQGTPFCARGKPREQTTDLYQITVYSDSPENAIKIAGQKAKCSICHRSLNPLRVK